MKHMHSPDGDTASIWFTNLFIHSFIHKFKKTKANIY